MDRLTAKMVNRRQTDAGTGRTSVHRVAVWLATIVVLFAHGAAAQGQTAQGQTAQESAVSRPRDVEGTLEIHYEDSADGARLTHFLNTGTERIPLHFQKNAPRHLLHGSRVRARGNQTAEVLELGSGTGSSMTTLALASPDTFGPQSTLVILFNFLDLTTQPYTPATAQSITFTDVNNFDLENSFGQTSLTGTVAGWYTIAAVSTTCNYSNWALLADQAATAAGVNVASYPRRVYAFPATNACAWYGLGTVGGGTVANPSRAWINTTYSMQVVAHEMGHNFGLYHSHSNACDGTGCTQSEYGDDHDVMGNYTTGHFNAYQKERLGWLNSGTSPPIQTVTSVGPYTLEAYETPSGGLPKALEVFKSNSAGANTYLYAEARTQHGIDTTAPPGVLIHSGVDTDGNQSFLQDVQPTTATSDFILDPGQSVTFAGDTSPITFTTLSSDASGAVVAVTQSPAPCTYSLGSTGQSMASGGGAGSVTLTTASDCYWNATSNAGWITLDAGSTNGVGSATIALTVAANASSSPRTGTVTITGQTYTVTQAGLGCSYTATPIAAAFNYNGGTGTVTVSTSGSCAWTAVSNASWITITSGATGTGNGSVTYSVASRPSGLGPRNRTMTIAGQTVTITQSAVSDTSLSSSSAGGTYGGTSTLSATLTANGSPVSGETVSFTLIGVPVGTASTNASGVATLSNVSLGGAAAGSYATGIGASIAADSAFNASSASSPLTVTQKAVTAAVTASNKTYDGNRSAILASCTLTGVVGNDVVSCGASPPTFDTASVGVGKTVTATGMTLIGSAAPNYTLASSTATATAAITAKTLTPAVTASDKAYDGTTSATVTSCTLTGVVGSDAVSCNHGPATFDTPNVGTGKTVTVTGLTLTGGAAANYTLASTTATTLASITGVVDTTAPTAPTGVTATAAGATQINLAWTAASDNVGVTGYRVERCAGAGCTTFVQVLTPSGTSVSDTGLVGGTAYSYRVRATDAAGNLGAYSATASATTTAAATISFVQVKAATPGSAQTTVTVTYTAAQTAGNLNVVVVGWGDTVRSVLTVTDSRNNVYAAAVGRTTNSSGGLSQTIYYARNIAAAAAGSNTVTVTFNGAAASPDVRILEYSGADPIAPVDVTATGTGSGSTSSATVTTTTAADLLVAADVVATMTTGAGAGFTSRIITADGNLVEDRMVTAIGSYTATAALSSGAWVAQVVAFRAASSSDTMPPTVPSGLTATAVSATQINLVWTAATDNVGVTGYRVERCAGPGCTTFAEISTPTGTSLSDTGLLTGTAYSYRVRATDAAGNLSGYSSTATATPLDTTAPTAPTGVTATAVSATQITLTWTAAIDDVAVTGYRVERCAGTGCTTFAEISAPAGTSLSDAGVVTGTAYSYRVRATDAAGNFSGYSATATATPLDTTAPTAPTSLTATVVGATQINLAWTAATDNVAVTGYRVERCAGTSCTTFAEIGTPTGTSLSDLGLVTGTAYSYRVRATDAAGNLSGYSNTVTATPSDTTAPTVPNGLTATAVSATQINLAWSAATDDVAVTGYRVERCAGTGCTTFAEIGAPSGTNLSDLGLVTATAYSYRVRATDAAGNLSGYSNTVSATPSDTTAPTVPNGLTATATSATQISLTWTAATDDVAVTGYRVERCAGTGCTTFAEVGAPAGTSLSDIGLTTGTAYSYRVRASDAAGNLSGYSNSATATPLDTTSPTAPASLTATVVSATQISLTWTAATDDVAVTGYRVERCAGTGCTTFAEIGAPAGTSLSDTGLTTGTAYSYRVRATDAAGNLSGYSPTATATPLDTTAPTAPASLTATAVNATQINLAWSAATDNVAVTGYRVERCAGTGCTTFAEISTPTATNFSDAGLVTGTAYSYRVRATDAAGNLSGYSPTATATPLDTTAPTAPTSLTATAVGTTQINLAWTAATDNVGVTGYRVERCAGTGCTTFAEISTPTATNFSDAGLVTGTAYSYRVRATDAAGNLSGYSPTATATPLDTTAPTAPTSLTATAVGTTQINLAWTAATDNVGVTGYRVERCAGTGCTTFTEISAPAGTSLSDPGLVTGTTYSYRVRASDAAGNLSGYSNTATATLSAPDTTAPSAPSGLTATAAGATQINLTWTAASDNVGVTGYRVERCAGAGCTTFVQVLTPSGTSVSDTGLVGGTAYSYRVRATDAAGNLGAYSATASATTAAAATISFVQVKAATPGSAQTTVTVTYTAAQTAGNLNVVVVGWGDTVRSVLTVTDSRNNVYAAAVGRTTNSSGGLSQTIYYARNIAAAAAGSNTVTVTFNGAAASPDVRILEYSGADPIAPVDVTATGTGSGSTSSATVTTTTAADLLVAADVVATMTTGAGAGFTSRIITADGNLVEDRMVTAIGSYTATAALSSGAWVTQLVAFRAAAALPPPDTTAPTVPSGLTATAVSATQINLVWTAATDNVGVTGYRVERCAGPGCTTFAEISAPTGTSLSDPGLVTGTTYSYRVRATDAAGNLSGYSSTATATPSDTTAPTVPSGLTATAISATQISLTWTAATDDVAVTGYRVERCAGTGCTTFVEIGTPAGTNLSDTGLTTGTAYSYRVRATDAAGNFSGYSNSATATPLDTTTPTAPASLTATVVSATQISLTWTAATDDVAVTGYRVERCAGTGCTTFVEIGTPTGTSLSDPGLVTGTTYSYRVRATDAAGNLSGYSPTATATPLDTTAPTAPTSLTATAVNATQINLAWSAATDNVAVTGYRVERCAGLGCTTFAEIGTPTGTSLSDTGLVTGTTYSYRVRATDAAGNLSGYSNSATATPLDTTAPTAPTSLTATTVSATQINLAWSAATDNVAVTGYRVERCAGLGCTTFAEIGTPTGTSLSDTGLATGTTYSYRVRATDAAANLSGYSNTATATLSAVDTTAPTAPSGLTATAAGATQINLVWTAATDNVGVTGYRVERCAGTGCTTFVQVLTPTGTSVSDTGLLAGTAYSYRVRATDAAGNLSAYSATASATTAAAATISFVQVKAATPGSAQTTVTVTYTAAQTAGNLNVVVVGWGDTVRSVLTVTDSRNNVYTPAVGRTSNSSGGLSQTIYYAKNIVAAPAGGNTVTVTFNGAAAFPDVRILEYSGADLVAPVDVTATGTGSGSTSSATVTTTTAADLLVAADVVATMTTGAGSGFTSRIITADGNLVEDRMVTAIGSYSATAAISSGAWVMQVVAFRAAAALPPPDTTAPTVPTSLTATAAGATQINLAWTAATDNVGVTGYRVERCAGTGCTTFTEISAPAGTSVSDTGLVTGTAYSYRVRATDAAGNLSGYSATATATPLDTTAPTVPSGLTATAASATQINLAWSAASDNVAVTGYRVERCAGTGCTTFAEIGTPTGTSLSDPGLVTGTAYSYRVRATDAAGNFSGYSNSATATPSDTTAPTAPSGLTATAVSATQISLTWTAASDNVAVTGYRVERCAGTGCTTFAEIGTPTGTSLSDTGLTTGTAYSYRVRATDAAANLSSYSLTATATPLDTTAPTAPTGLTATAAAATQINLAWSAATDDVGVTGYRVERCAGTGCTTFAEISAPTGLSLNDTGLATGTAYSYRVRATDAAGNLSSYSLTATATPLDTTAPTAPTSVTATVAGATQINLVWTAATDDVAVTGYRVERCAGTGCTTFAEISAPVGTSLNDTGLATGTAYSYRVRATDAAGNLSGYSLTATATPLDTTAPTTPSGLTATAAGATQVNLAWSAATDNVAVTGYRVERCAGTGCTTFAEISAPVGTSVSDTGLVTGTAYSYRVRATDAAGNLSGYSLTATATPTDTTPPTAPSGLTATAASVTQVNLAWAAATDNVGVTGYRVERCAGTGCTTFAEISAPVGTTLSDTGLVTGTPYSYRVRATDAAGNLSGYSATATATPSDTTAPTAPSGLTATAVGATQINLTWTAATDNIGVTGYRVERCAGAGCTTFVQVLTPSGTSVSDTGLLGGTAYSYRVRATDAAGNLGAYSGTASATTTPATISFVQVKAATPDTAQTTVAVSYTAAQTAGNLNVVVIGWGDTVRSVATVTDSRNNVYTAAVGRTTNSSAGLSQTIYYAKNIAAGSNTVTVTFSGAAAFPDVRILEYSGADPIAPLDVTGTGTGSGSTSSATVTTTAAADLLVMADVVATMSTGAGTGFTSRIITADGNLVEDRMVSAPGSYTATAVLSSGAWVSQLVAFRAAGSP